MMKAISQPAGTNANLLVFFMEIVLTYWNYDLYAQYFHARLSAAQGLLFVKNIAQLFSLWHMDIGIYERLFLGEAGS